MGYPNQFAGHPWEGNDVDVWEQYEEYNAGLLRSKAYGFTYDSTPVATSSPPARRFTTSMTTI